MNRDPGSREPTNAKRYSSDGKDEKYAGNRKPGNRVIAKMKEYSGSWEPRNNTGHSRCSSLQPCSWERFPQCNVSAPAGRGLPLEKLLQLQFYSGMPKCNNSAVLEEGFPNESVTALPGSGILAKSCYFSPLIHSSERSSHSNLIKEIYWEEESRRAAASAGWKER